jgi:uncharacterized membrane protein
MRIDVNHVNIGKSGPWNFGGAGHEPAPLLDTAPAIPLHAFAAMTAFLLGVWRALRHRVADHRRIMISIFSGALVVAGLFTLVPGRIMHAVVFGPWRRSKLRS